jgi:hypothetical protein
MLAISQTTSNVTATLLMAAAPTSASDTGFGLDGNKNPPRRRRIPP